MEGIQGAILRVKLRHLERWTEQRRANARRYGELLAGSGVRMPEEMAYARHVYHVYAVRVHERDAMHQRLAARGIQTGIHYPLPVHLQEAWRDERYGPGDFPVAEQAAREVLSLPIYPELTEAQIESVAGALKGGLKPAAG
jgi:dTDP-4-amino-4,6-dideoxygalactose transaminase